MDRSALGGRWSMESRQQLTIGGGLPRLAALGLADAKISRQPNPQMEVKGGQISMPLGVGNTGRG